ncbi:dihydroorotate dehydrogenase electron transfer subunit [Serpentinicella sp. ANB-PHB4]|uniref:dihydroorotate dehydrogenase electron transfer subunit n=1 Tax=Serpentinicella sp. ANB-PHB4 TaxID=3074076 RepID=UPI00285E576F|nr:dihydroorotate dehydrogenase electron transfer subunit [Serpentinicella sp. ANB-PHB4]MDR5659322.1 dihydroorotate dehydrogenase electron transfer subunit [Serpentinicella sp. ANB-PHB4]
MNRWKNVKILSNKEIVPGMYELDILAPKMAQISEPGQFMNLYCKSESRLLPRPISICEINKEAETLKLIYAVVGKGTEEISQMREGETIKVMGPFGNGFKVGKEQDHIIIGGGVGTPPLLELVKHLKGKKRVYLGFRTNPILVEAFEKHGAEVHVATEDGSFGTKGNVMDILTKTEPQGDIVYSCGPKPMLKAVYNWAKEKNIPSQLSFEERMACGIGACLVCTCKIQREQEVDWENRRVCKDGPVFNGDEVIWDD